MSGFCLRHLEARCLSKYCNANGLCYVLNGDIDRDMPRGSSSKRCACFAIMGENCRWVKAGDCGPGLGQVKRYRYVVDWHAADVSDMDAQGKGLEAANL